MATITRFSVLVVFALALFTGLARAVPFDGGIWPVLVNPSESVVEPGTSTSVAVTVNQAGSTPTTVYLSSSHPQLLQVPSSTTFSTGQTTKYFNANATYQENVSKTQSMDDTSTVVRITASANGYSAYADVTVRSQ